MISVYEYEWCQYEWLQHDRWYRSSKMNRVWNGLCDLCDFMNGICARYALHEEKEKPNTSSHKMNK